MVHPRKIIFIFWKFNFGFLFKIWHFNLILWNQFIHFFAFKILDEGLNALHRMTTSLITHSVWQVLTKIRPIGYFYKALAIFSDGFLMMGKYFSLNYQFLCNWANFKSWICLHFEKIIKQSCHTSHQFQLLKFQFWLE